MDKEALEIYEDGCIPMTPELWTKEWCYLPTIKRLGLNATLTKEIRNGRLFLCIWPESGGWLGCYLDNLLGDIAPDAG